MVKKKIAQKKYILATTTNLQILILWHITLSEVISFGECVCLSKFLYLHDSLPPFLKQVVGGRSG
jgi:hypothetical protein